MESIRARPAGNPEALPVRRNRGVPVVPRQGVPKQVRRIARGQKSPMDRAPARGVQVRHVVVAAHPRDSEGPAADRPLVVSMGEDPAADRTVRSDVARGPAAIGTNPSGKQNPFA